MIGNNMSAALKIAAVVRVGDTSHEISGKLRTMAGAHHCRELATKQVLISLLRTEATDAALPGKGFSAFERRLVVRAQRFGNVARYSRLVQGRFHTPVAVTLTGERSRFRLGKRLIVDIARRDTALDDGSNRGSAFVFPAALGNLARQIGRQLGPRGRISPDITDRERL
jgi:hypothetical protein